MSKLPQLENMKRTAEQLYEYETKRIEQYLYKFDTIFKTYMLLQTSIVIPHTTNHPIAFM